MPAFAKRRAAEDPTGFALVDATREYTWGDVDEALNRCANLLLEAGRSGALGTEHRVAVFAENAAETALAHLGGLLAGTSTVPVNFHLTASEAAYILSDSESRIVFVGPETVERGLAAAAEAGVETVIGWACDGIDGVIDWDEWLAGGSTDDPPDSVIPRPNLLYTSGTTGLPRGPNCRPRCSRAVSTWPSISNASPKVDSPCSGRTSSWGRCITPGRCRECDCCVPACHR